MPVCSNVFKDSRSFQPTCSSMMRLRPMGKMSWTTRSTRLSNSLSEWWTRLLCKSASLTLHMPTFLNQSKKYITQSLRMIQVDMCAFVLFWCLAIMKMIKDSLYMGCGHWVTMKVIMHCWKVLVSWNQQSNLFQNRYRVGSQFVKSGISSSHQNS